MNQGGNYWTLFTPGIWKVLHAVFHTDTWRFENGRWLMVASRHTASSQQGGVATLSPQEQWQVAQQMQNHTNQLLQMGNSMMQTQQDANRQFMFNQNLHAPYNWSNGH